MPLDGSNLASSFAKLPSLLNGGDCSWMAYVDASDIRLGEYRHIVIATLRRSRALVARRGGWVRKSPSRLTRWLRIGYCSGAAIDVASQQVVGRIDNVQLVVRQRAVMIMQRVIGPRWSISAWNDVKGRKQGEVVAMFDRGIAFAERLA